MYDDRIIAVCQHIATPIANSDHQQFDLKIGGGSHWRNTSSIRFWAFSYSMAEPCGRSFQVIMYFMPFSSVNFQLYRRAIFSACAGDV